MNTRAQSTQPEIAVPGPFSCIPPSLHISSEAGPFARNFGAEGVHLQLLQADVEGGFFVVRIRFEPGTLLPPHKQTGAVNAFTLAGECQYL